MYIFALHENSVCEVLVLHRLPFFWSMLICYKFGWVAFACRYNGSYSTYKQGGARGQPPRVTIHTLNLYHPW